MEKKRNCIKWWSFCILNYFYASFCYLCCCNKQIDCNFAFKLLIFKKNKKPELLDLMDFTFELKIQISIHLMLCLMRIAYTQCCTALGVLCVSQSFIYCVVVHN